MDIEQLRAKLVAIANDAPKNSHNEVADNLDITTESLYKTRIGKTLTTDNPDNRERIKEITSEYLKIIKREFQNLKKYDRMRSPKFKKRV